MKKAISFENPHKRCKNDIWVYPDQVFFLWIRLRSRKNHESGSGQYLTESETLLPSVLIRIVQILMFGFYLSQVALSSVSFLLASFEHWPLKALLDIVQLSFNCQLRICDFDTSRCHLRKHTGFFILMKGIKHEPYSRISIEIKF